MRISPYNYLVSRRPTINKKNECSFGTLYDKDWGGINLIGDGIRYSNGPIKNYTKLIRGVKVFKELPQYLKTTYPNGATIFDYACSAGHEASSIIISLFNGLHPKEVEKFLPIKAFDNNPKVVKMAQKYALKLDNREMCDFKRLDRVDVKDFLVSPRMSVGKQRTYKMSDKLKDNIQFDFGDLFEDLKEGKLSKEPCVLFFRNAWQFLTHKGAIELATTLFEKLPSKSTVIIGEKDIEEQRANKILERIGFKKMLDTKVINPVEQNFKDRFVAIMEGESLSTYCFTKP